MIFLQKLAVKLGFSGDMKMDNLCSSVIKNEKIKVTSVEIVVHGTVDKPYFELEYYYLLSILVV